MWWFFWVIILVLLLLNLRSFPLFFHLTLLKEIIMIRIGLLKKGSQLQRIFQGFSKSYIVWPDDLDFNIHMNNSVYYKNADFGRIDLILASGLWDFLRSRKYAIHNGGVYFSFRRELKPFQAYKLVTSIHSWDQKWIYFRQAFMVKETTHAIGFCKMVVKKGRLTINPSELMEQLKEAYPELQIPDSGHFEKMGAQITGVEDFFLKLN